MSKRVEGADGKLSKVIRINAPHEVGRKSLGQDEIARWPHDGASHQIGRLPQAAFALCRAFQGIT
jgi:hypothetical protein